MLGDQIEVKVHFTIIKFLEVLQGARKGYDSQVENMPCRCESQCLIPVTTKTQ